MPLLLIGSIAVVPVQAIGFSTRRAVAARARFLAITAAALVDVEVSWELDAPRGTLLGTVHLPARRQPFALRLQSLGSRLLIRCVSPVGRVGPENTHDEILASVARRNVRIGAISATDQDRTYDLTVEDDTLLADEPTTDALRVSMLVRRVAQEADALEQHHLPGNDEALAAFRAQLEEETRHDRVHSDSHPYADPNSSPRSRHRILIPSVSHALIRSAAIASVNDRL